MPTATILHVGTYLAGFAVLWCWARWAPTLRARELAYLLASYAFYATWETALLGVLIFSSLVNYTLIGFLRRRLSVARLWVGILFNIVLLSVFKYLPLAGSVSWIDQRAPWLSAIVLPLGISFWSFQAISYLLDVYREEDVNPSLVEFCLFMAFWPTVISGPICRLPDILPQFRRRVALSSRAAGAAIQRVLVGFLMMMVSQMLATGIATGHGVDAGFSVMPQRLGALDVWMLAAGYGFQLFFNFAGYSHVAIGAAALFGIRLPENFNRPFLSTSASEFWTRWHMSLSFWIREYVFFPLATLKRSLWWRHFSLILSMFVFGLWHKGSVLFMLWGTYHGVLLVLHRLIQQHGVPSKLQSKLHLPDKILTLSSWFLTTAAILLGWILFRAPDLASAAAMLRTLGSPSRYATLSLPRNFYVLVLLVAAGYFVVTGVSALLDRKRSLGLTFPSNTGFGRGGVDRAWRALATDRWVWVAPLVLVLSLYIFLTVRIEGSLVGPMMYQVF